MSNYTPKQSIQSQANAALQRLTEEQRQLIRSERDLDDAARLMGTMIAANMAVCFEAAALLENGSN